MLARAWRFKSSTGQKEPLRRKDLGNHRKRRFHVALTLTLALTLSQTGRWAWNVEPYSIHKRPTTRKNRHVYYARFRDEAGHYNSAISTGRTNRDDAVRWCEQRLRDGQERKTSITLKEFAEGFWKQSGPYAGRIAHGFALSAGTLYVAELITAKHIIPKWGSWLLNDLSSGKIDAWIVQLRKESGLAPASVNHILQAMRTILGQAVSDGFISENPASFVKPVKSIPAKRGILTSVEVRKLLASPSLWRKHNHFVLNLLAASTGARMGEIRALQVQDVFADHIEIRHSWEEHSGLKDPKWGSARSIPIAHQVFARLSELTVGAACDSFVFHAEERQELPLSKRAIEDGLYEAMERIGIGDKERRIRRLSFHSWRHWLSTTRARLPLAWCTSTTTRVPAGIIRSAMRSTAGRWNAGFRGP